MRAVTVITDQIPAVSEPVPRGAATAANVVASWDLSARRGHDLDIDVEFGAFVGWAGDAPAEVGWYLLIALESTDISPTLAVGYLTSSGDCGSAGGVPVETIKDHQHDTLGTG
jgi:hypothetical protein